MSGAPALAAALLAGCALAAGVAVRAHATEAPREIHGMADAFAVPGVALAWGVLRGASEAATVVVVRIVADPAAYPWVAVAGRDPFTQAQRSLLPVTPTAGVVDLRAPRAHFADFPRSEFRFYDSAAATRDNAPGLVVFYLGVPDTTPEFATGDKLEAYLSDRIARVRGGIGAKAP